MKCLKPVDNWKSLAAFLLNDEDGSKAAQIEKCNRSDIAECRRQLIQDYLKSDNVSWEHFLKALRSAEHKILADKIEKSLG